MPMIRTRSGFTLIELLIVLVMLGLVGGITVRVLTDTQRITVAQGERALMQATARAGALVVPAELREINPAFGDITAMDETSITYRSMRTLATTCVPPTTTSLRVATAGIRGLRDFAVGDSLLVFAEGADPNSADDDDWALSAITAISTATACPDGTAGTTLTMANSTMPDASAPVYGQFAIVRGFLETTMESYVDGDGVTWLGMASPSTEEIQPVLGPIAADSGLRLAYRDAAGVVTATATDVRSIDVAVISITSRPVHKGQQTPAVEYDSLSTRVALRNSF